MASGSSGTSSPISSLLLQDRVAIVTGASRGIGRAIALHLASLGAKLVINYISNKVQADLVATEMNSSFPGSTLQALTVQADVSDSSQVKSLFDIAEQFFNSQPHILVNSAGINIAKSTPVANTSVEDYNRALRKCKIRSIEGSNRCNGEDTGKGALGDWHYCKLCHPGQLQQRCSLQVTVRKVCKKRLMSAHSEDVAPIVGFLASDASEWVNGQVIHVNGGCI
ncbi:hypothetical protein CRYUN_Cryun16bG0015000 [Craigia yunnanensis]